MQPFYALDAIATAANVESFYHRADFPNRELSFGFKFLLSLCPVDEFLFAIVKIYNRGVCAIAVEDCFDSIYELCNTDWYMIANYLLDKYGINVSGSDTYMSYMSEELINKILVWHNANLKHISLIDFLQKTDNG